MEQEHMLPIFWKRLHELGKAPTCAYLGDDAGSDLYVIEDRTIHRGGVFRVRTGVAVEAPPGWWLEMRGRSSSLQRGLFVHPAVIDNGYRGELVVCVSLTADAPPNVFIEEGERIAQLIPHRVNTAVWYERDELTPSERGEGGWGSTGGNG